MRLPNFDEPIGNDETGACAALPVWLEFIESMGRETFISVDNRLSAAAGLED